MVGHVLLLDRLLEVPTAIAPRKRSSERRNVSAARREGRFKSIDDTMVQWIHLCVFRICMFATRACQLKRIDAMPVIKAAAVQMSSVLYSREGTVDRVVRKIIELGRQSVQFATFPETSGKVTRSAQSCRRPKGIGDTVVPIAAQIERL